MTHHKRSQEAKKRRQDLYNQKQASRRYIYDNQFQDRVTSEKVNMVEPHEVEANLKKQFEGVILGAVPNVARAEVLEMPNVYHLELFPFTE